MNPSQPIVGRAITHLLSAGMSLDKEPFDVQITEAMADALWLAKYRLFEASHVEAADANSGAPVSGIQEKTGKTQDRADQQTKKAADLRTKDPRGTAASRGVFPVAAGGGEDGGPSASPVRVPGGLALPDALAIGRAFRPLRRYRNSQFAVTLDEDETVNRTAADGRLTLAFRPVREKMLEIALVVDETASMTVWRRTVDEFQRLLELQGAFRDVRRLRLRLDHGPSLLNRNGTLASPHQLKDPSGHKVILVLTQGTHPAWREQTIYDWLWSWGSRQPVAVVQLLPRNSWIHTVLGEEATVCKSPASAVANTKLSILLPSHYDPEDPQPLAIPIVPLERKAIADWANMTMAVRGMKSPALLIDRAPEPLSERAPQAELPPRERVAGFERSGSPEAFHLVCSLTPIQFNISVLRLVQRTILGIHARQSQLAEVLLSGLIQRMTPAVGGDIDGEQIVYRVREDVAPLLKNRLTVSDAFDILKALSDFIGEHSGEPIEFTALVPDPKGQFSLPKWAHPFASAGAALLGHLNVPVYGVAPSVRAQPAIALVGTPLPSLRAALEAHGHTVFEELTQECKAAIVVDETMEDMGNMASESQRTGIPHILYRPQPSLDFSSLFKELDEALASPIQKPKGEIVNFPPLPEFYFERPDLEDQIADAILGGQRPIWIIGEKGSGRLTLVNRVVRRNEIGSRFPGGLLFDRVEGSFESLLVSRFREGPNSTAHVIIGTKEDLTLSHGAPAIEITVSPLDVEQRARYMSLVTGRPAHAPEIAATARSVDPGVWPDLSKGCAMIQLCEIEPYLFFVNNVENKVDVDEEAATLLQLALKAAPKADLEFLCTGRTREIPNYLLSPRYIPSFQPLIHENFEIDEPIYKVFHAAADSNPEIHKRFAQALLDHIDDDFARQNIIYHLVKAHDTEALTRQFRDAKFLIARCRADGYTALAEDLKLAGHTVLLEHLENFVSKSTPNPDIVPALAIFNDTQLARAAIRVDGPATFVLVAGSADFEISDIEQRAAFSVGSDLGRSGVGLITGGYQGVDATATEAYLSQKGPRLIQVVDEGSSERFPEALQIESHPQQYRDLVLADAVVIIGGRDYVQALGRAAVEEGKIVLPFVPSGKAAKRTIDLLRTRHGDRLNNQSLLPDEFAEIVMERIKPPATDSARRRSRVDDLAAIPDLSPYDLVDRAQRFEQYPSEDEVRAAMSSPDPNVRRAGYALMGRYANVDDVRDLAAGLMSDTSRDPLLHGLILAELLRDSRFWPGVDIDPKLLSYAMTNVQKELSPVDLASSAFGEADELLRQMDEAKYPSSRLARNAFTNKILEKMLVCDDPSKRAFALRNLEEPPRDFPGYLMKIEGDPEELRGAAMEYLSLRGVSTTDELVDYVSILFRTSEGRRFIFPDLLPAPDTQQVAVWDSTGQFGVQLPAILETLNPAQSIYWFHQVDLGFLDSARPLPRNDGYLDANQFAKTLSPLLKVTGLSYLSVIVNTRMVCDVATSPVYNIFGWWPGPGEPRVLLFSTSGLGLAPSGPQTGRALGNMMAGGIAGALMDINSHTKGPRDCPNYYNAERNVTLLTGKQKFCTDCLKKMRRFFPKETKALEAMFSAMSPDGSAQ